MPNNLHSVILTTTSGHTFSYSMNPQTVAKALVKLEQSQLHAEKMAMREGGKSPLPRPDSAPIANGE